MSSIRGTRTKPELVLRRLLGGRGYSYQPRFVGNPDFLNRKAKIAVFVDGCFWHGCPRCYVEPKSNISFWRKKIKRNRLNDRKAAAGLKVRGYRVVRIWEHSIRQNPGRAMMRLQKLESA